MNRDLKIILVKFFIITVLVIAYVFIAFYYIAPAVTHSAYGQYGGLPQDQYGSQNFAQPYQDPNQFNNQFQQGYNSYNQYPSQQYGTPYMQGYNQPYQQAGPYGINNSLDAIIAAIISGGGSVVYARRRSNKLEDDNQLLYAEMLKDKQRLAELARVSYTKMPDQGSSINDAPLVKLEELNKNIEQFTDKTAKA